jgi:drug/metabolite transporter (DMT)-like permease
MLAIGIALGLAIVFASIGDILLSTGMRENGELKIRGLRDILGALRRMFTQPKVLFGLLAMTGYFGSYMAALTMVDVSVANPLTALSYLIATLYATAILRERVSVARAVGIVLIVLGAICVGLSS